MVGRQRRELFHTPGGDDTRTNQDRANALLRKSYEGRFEIAIGSGVRNNKLQAQHAGRRLQVGDDGLETRKRRVRENAKLGSIGRQLAEQLQLFRR
jgi:hypothetical protein